ncbi:MAG: DNA double-strand break repair nuclease NurA [Cyanobacteria bacterium]|nr:DNA double-strand break repair nuclease NurA [Cyanobacteria bacterium CG_2015-16_32_12]NCO78086.1 DNA double-strand break repair nuclease NurA [Cyanobacteria bacterium CG_2015-22_32_23]NCQ05129.1 DNA double-strand break repair nuclease NurA [Cyanobacteria bacterium CG_2015-09_32_10]NCQ40381.1 DNA double-strand break repair nuclease NurA [Cyanobacteria bacterium CG_2015-04_32_10]NCS83839.1 DNA double-strand break repair nuclease NurA [Cyanobacteria bacterium CG_2015-02_32_10]
MLDLAKLAQQMPNIGLEMQKDALASVERLKLAQSVLIKTVKSQNLFIKIQEEWCDRLIFTPATPLEPITTCIDIELAEFNHSVFSADGSQIAPSHHEIAYCYLINIGRIMLHYGQNLHPLLDTLPEIYYKPEDLYVSRKWGIRTEEWMSYKRTVAEAEVLAEMACTWVNPPGAHFNIPNLAMTDGSLIFWFLETIAMEAREQILTPILQAWQQLQEAKIPFVGYISASRSMEAVNFLRLPQCAYEKPNCVAYCGEEINKTPCQKIEPIRDATLWSSILKPRQRSAIFRSNSRILDLYGEEQYIYFCYLHVGTEVARIEFPRWVAQDSALLHQALSITLTQVNKGFGYPVALAEAHNLAVVKGGDRSRFFALLEDQMIRAGLHNVGTSYKEARKRGSIA